MLNGKVNIWNSIYILYYWLLSFWSNWKPFKTFHISTYGGMVIMVGNRPGELGLNHGQSCLHLVLMPLWKTWIYLFSQILVNSWADCSLVLVSQLIYKWKTLNFNLAEFTLKLTLYCILSMSEESGKHTHTHCCTCENSMKSMHNNCTNLNER